MHNFKDLRVWQSGIEVAKLIFQLTRTYPLEERYGLIAQLNRCAASIPSNIAEGCGRKSTKEFYQFLSISLGSSFELETQLILSSEFGYIEKEHFESIISQINEVQKMITGLQKSLHT
ncbi:four helix bundle protein [compost metagenome]